MEGRIAAGGGREAATLTPLTISSPGSNTSAQVTKSSAQLVRTSTSHPSWETSCSANWRAAVSAPPTTVGP